MAAVSAVRPAPTRTAATPPARALQRRCACGSKATSGAACDPCRERQLLGLQRQPAAAARSGAPGTPSRVDAVLASPGRPLDAAPRQFFEARFGRDFGDVRIHADERAAASARVVDALAYTSGRDIVFGSGRYDPASTRGMRLLAHELTHIVQQRAGLAAAGSSRADDPAEREAERNADRLHSGAALTFDARAPALARQAAAAAAPAVTACDADQQSTIDPARELAEQWLERALERLDAYIAAPGDDANASVRTALTEHFHSVDPAVVARVRGLLERARGDLDAREHDPAAFECHADADASCTNNSAFARGALIVLCPPFFAESSLRERAGSLVHETVHALPDGAHAHVPDRGYDTDRVLPHLGTAEALNNAESYSMFVRELVSGRAVRGTPPRDDIDEDCPTATRDRIREALGRAQRWNNRAMTVANGTSSDGLFTTHLGDAAAATRAAAARIYTDMVTRLRSPVDVRCDAQAESECGSRRAYKKVVSHIGRGLGIGAGIGGGVGLIAGLVAGAATSSLGIGLGVGFGLLGLGLLIGLIAGAASRTPEVHVCPNWVSLPTTEDRTESLLAAIYETYANLDARQSQRYAALARALHADYPGAPPPI